VYKETRPVPPGYSDNSRSIPKTTTPVLDSWYLRGVLNPFLDKVKESVDDDQGGSESEDLGMKLDDVDLASGFDWETGKFKNDDDLIDSDS
jgi:hypothetical protein